LSIIENYTKQETFVLFTSRAHFKEREREREKRGAGCIMNIFAPAQVGVCGSSFGNFYTSFTPSVDRFEIKWGAPRLQLVEVMIILAETVAQVHLYVSL
jgi:hypothetical protein